MYWRVLAAQTLKVGALLVLEQLGHTLTQNDVMGSPTIVVGRLGFGRSKVGCLAIFFLHFGCFSHNGVNV